ncbi:FtsX-like permease family protein, partial [Actinomadura sp. DSM 109109]|nr:FtsX-like permease family protein [Actinomadura lepetitiana]
EKSLAAFPAAVVETREEFKDTRTAEITQSLQILYALLGLSVIVSLFGVINTLVLSVFERTRELGMLRAIGMTRRQVRRMIRHESIVTALIGAALGIGVGLFLAVLTTAALSQYGIVFAVPRRMRSWLVRWPKVSPVGRAVVWLRYSVSIVPASPTMVARRWLAVIIAQAS